MISRIKKITQLLLPLLALMQVNAAENTIFLQSHEPNTVGVRYDSNDVNYIEFKLSQKYPLGHSGKFDGRASWPLYMPFTYFAFTGVWGQYLGTRHSSPVIAKRYNPELWGRWWLSDGEDYIDFTFLGHESNGQSIDSYSIYQAKEAETIRQGDNPEFTRDYISRGWDYVGLTWKNGNLLGKSRFQSFLKLRYFLDNGPLQGNKENYNPWEDDAACSSDDKATWTTRCRQLDKKYTRNKYDGISVIVRKDYRYHKGWISGNKIAVLYTTGYQDVFKNSTARFEFTTILGKNVPIMLWAQSGYNSDMIDYYKHVNSAGIALEMSSFL